MFLTLAIAAGLAHPPAATELPPMPSRHACVGTVRNPHGRLLRQEDLDAQGNVVQVAAVVDGVWTVTKTRHVVHVRGKDDRETVFWVEDDNADGVVDQSYVAEFQRGTLQRWAFTNARAVPVQWTRYLYEGRDTAPAARSVAGIFYSDEVRSVERSRETYDWSDDRSRLVHRFWIRGASTLGGPGKVMYQLEDGRVVRAGLRRYVWDDDGGIQTRVVDGPEGHTTTYASVQGERCLLREARLPWQRRTAP